MKFGFLIIIPVLLPLHVLFGQIDTSLLLSPILIRDLPPLSLIDSFKNIKSNVVLDNLSRVDQHVSRNGEAFVRSYGIVSSSMTLRGTNPSQNTILWNEVPILNPIIGVLDASLIRLPGYYHSKVVTGGNSGLWGSGAFGGVFHLYTDEKSKEGYHLDIQAIRGSFHSYSTNLSQTYKNEKVFAAQCISYQNALNNLTYVSNNDSIRRLTNAHQVVFTMNHDVKYQINNKLSLNFHQWFIQAKRQIPPLRDQRFSNAHQFDQAARWLVTSRYILSNTSHLSIKQAVYNEQIDFEDDTQNIDSKAKFTSFLTDIDYSFKFMSALHLIGVTSQVTKASNSGYKDVINESRLAVFYKGEIKHNRIHYYGSARQEWVDNERIRIVPSIGAQYKNIDQSIFLRLNRLYRIPALNDKYWRVGGNPLLKPEIGYGIEAGIVKAYALSPDFHVLCSNEQYFRIVNDWIQWLRLPNQFFFSANNIQKVQSFGSETEVNLKFNRNQFRATLVSKYHFVHSTYEVDILLPKISKGDQLWYQPKHAFSNHISIEYKNCALSLFHNYRSRTQGINKLINPYHLYDVHLMQRLKMTKKTLDVFCHINNLFDQDYEVIERYLMPGRNIQFGISFNYSQ